MVYFEINIPSAKFNKITLFELSLLELRRYNEEHVIGRKCFRMGEK